MHVGPVCYMFDIKLGSHLLYCVYVDPTLDLNIDLIRLLIHEYFIR